MVNFGQSYRASQFPHVIKLNLNGAEIKLSFICPIKYVTYEEMELIAFNLTAIICRRKS